MRKLLFSALALPVFVAVVCVAVASAQNAPKNPTAPTKNPLPPVGTYADYAFSTNAKSFDPNDPVYAQLGALPPGVKAIGEGFVELGCGSSQVVLKMPMGWLGDEDGQNSTLFTPDQSTRIIMGFRDMGEKTSFAAFKTRSLAATRAQMKALKQTGAIVRGFEVPGGSYAIEVSGVTTTSGAKNGFLQVFTPNPKPSRYVMSLSLTAPAPEFSKYRGLVGLILRDREIIW